MRDSLDTLRVIYWYEGVKSRAGTGTAYALEHLVEPEAFGRNADGDPYHRNKWRAYEEGKRTPRKSLVERVETLFPGTRSALQHVLWRSLDANDCQNDEALNDLLRRLTPELQLLLDDADIWSGQRLTQKKPGVRLLTQLQRRASLDALACATVLTRRATQLGDMDNAYFVGGTAFNILLAMGPHFRDRKISQLLFALFVDRIFATLKGKGMRYYFERYDFDSSAVMLDFLAKNVKETRGRNLTVAEEMSYKSTILHGKYGFDCMFALRPIEGPAVALSDAKEDDIKEFERNVRLQAWGWHNVIHGGKQRFPPDEVWHGYGANSTSPQR